MTTTERLQYHGKSIDKFLTILRMQYIHISVNPFIPWWKKWYNLWIIQGAIRKMERLRTKMQQQLNVEYFKSL